MGASSFSQKINILVVAYWPLGGIRTYMKYTYKYLSKDHFNLTILARKTNEDEAFLKDAEDLGAELIFANPVLGKDALFYRAFQLLYRGNYHIVQSHGFISGVHAYLANITFKIPHVLTVHGIIEDHLMGKGPATFLKTYILRKMVNSVDIIYGVSQDILDHVSQSLNITNNTNQIMIHNGIDIDILKINTSETEDLRQWLNVSDSSFIIGFFGRFMPQKGFNFLIDAVGILEGKDKMPENWKVLAVGSHDYLREYQTTIKQKKLDHRFVFIPFQEDIIPFYKIVDVVVMPSIWEAFGLQAAEALCLGVPIIISKCLGLKEAAENTPAITINVGDPLNLAEAIYSLTLKNCKDDFKKYATEAINRFDVRHTSVQLAALFESLIR